MQQLAVKKQKRASLEGKLAWNTRPTGKERLVVKERPADGRQLIAFVHEGRAHQTLVSAKPDWAVHVFEEDGKLFVCSFSPGRAEICIERFAPTKAPFNKVYAGASRAAAFGADFSVKGPMALVNAVKPKVP